MSNLTQDLTSYRANCHCGAVTFTFQTPSLTYQEVTSCNCSICTRNGYLLVYPERKNVEFHSGYDQLVSYRFGHKVGSHKFCPTCGSSVLCDFDAYEQLAINVRLIQDVDTTHLKLKYVDGKSTNPDYEVTNGSRSDTSATFLAKPDITPYPANCHCGLVTYTVRIPSLAQHKVSMCNCSICTRNGYLLVYPEREDVIFHTGYDDLQSYLFGKKKCPHKFCPKCGSSILIDFDRNTERDLLAVNTRMLQGVDPEQFKYKYFDGKTELGPEYTVGRREA